LRQSRPPKKIIERSLYLFTPPALGNKPYRMKNQILPLLSFLAIAIFACEKDEPAPPISVVSIKAEGVELLGEGGQVAVPDSIFIAFNVPVSATTVTTSNFKIYQGAGLIPVFISVAESTVALAPVNLLRAQTTYTIKISPSVESDQRVRLGTETAVSFTTK
jgi:Bacterial Ig-like domain